MFLGVALSTKCMEIEDIDDQVKPYVNLCKEEKSAMLFLRERTCQLGGAE